MYGIASYSLWHGRHIARLQIPVSGPNGDGVLFVYAVKPEDSWDMIEFVLGHEDEYWDILEGVSVDGGVPNFPGREWYNNGNGFLACRLRMACGGSRTPGMEAPHVNH